MKSIDNVLFERIETQFAMMSDERYIRFGYSYNDFLAAIGELGFVEVWPRRHHVNCRCWLENTE